MVSIRRYNTLKQCETYNNERGDWKEKYDKVLATLKRERAEVGFSGCMSTYSLAVKLLSGNFTEKAVSDRHTVTLRRENRPMVHEKPGHWSQGRWSLFAVQFLYETVHARKSGRWKQVVAIHGGRLRGAWRDHSFPEPFSWFLHETGLESLKITSARSFFIEMSKERLEKSETTPPVSWRPRALAYSHDRPYNFPCLSAVLKNRRLRSFFSALGSHLARKSLSWPAMPTSNKKKQEFEQRKWIKLFDDFWVRAYRFDFAPRRRPRAR